MDKDKLTINITKNPTNFCEESRMYKAKWQYNYSADSGDISHRCHGGYILDDLYNKIQETLEYYNAREKELPIIVKSEITKSSFADAVIVPAGDLELIKVQLFKSYSSVQLDF